jgi:hypothetical protein
VKLTEDDVERALHYLVNNAQKAAKARADRIVVEEYLRVVKSQIMKEQGDIPVSAQEREAYADPRYKQHLEAIREAVERDEYHRFLREAASAKIEAWRTQSSNERANRI